MIRLYLTLPRPHKERNLAARIVGRVVIPAISLTTVGLKRLRIESKNFPLKIALACGVSRDLRCPACRGRKIRRSHRRNLFEKAVSLSRIYPFRCTDCQHRFWITPLRMCREPWMHIATICSNVFLYCRDYRKR
jgi:hypothetical protein